MKSSIKTVLGLILLTALHGCNLPASAPPVSSTATAEGEAAADHAAHDHAGKMTEMGEGKSDMDKMTAALANVSEEERASAMKQHFCPVSGEMLGTMGAPEKIDVNGQAVWICCDGCKDKLLGESDKYLAKLNK